MLLASHQGRSRDRLRFPVRVTTIAGSTPRAVQMRAQDAFGWWGAMLVSEDPRTMLSQERCDARRGLQRTVLPHSPCSCSADVHARGLSPAAVTELFSKGVEMRSRR